MGVTWVVEIVSFAFPDTVILYLASILNCLQGIIIFILFVCKPNVKKLIARRFESVKDEENLLTNKFFLRFGKSSLSDRHTISSKYYSTATTGSVAYSTQASNMSTSSMVSFG